MLELKKIILSEAEDKFLVRFEKYVKKIYLNYITVGVSACTAMVSLIIGVVLSRKELFLVTIFFGGIGINIFLLSRKYQMLFKIISKMKQHITELEKKD